MTDEKRISIMLILGVAASFVLGASALIVIVVAGNSAPALPVIATVPEFEFVKQDGSPFGLNNMLGKINVVDFIFTTCGDICPAMSGNMARLYSKFDGSDKVQFVSISVDPDRDSLDVLKRYAASFGVNDNRWVFLWQTKEDVVKLSEKGFMLTAENLPEGHSNRFVLVDDKGRIRGYYDGVASPGTDRIAKDIVILAKESK